MSTALVPVSALTGENQFCLPFPNHLQTPTLAITREVSAMLHSGCVVAIGVSGGKDSQACAVRTVRYLDEIGHNGPRVLVHADLGVIEWTDSLPVCERLAAHLCMELIVVRRRAGDMLSRWQKRWENNVRRYRELECVRLILPWSSAKMRFCTSELKTGPIRSALRKRFPRQAIVNVSGIRRQESAARSRMPVWTVDPRLARKRAAGIAWNPILEWDLEQVLTEVRNSGLALHVAYTRYGISRVSCAFCVLSSGADLAASSACSENHEVYVALVELEAASTFAFQGHRWLADVAPQLLPAALRARIERAKLLAQMRRTAEAEIPDHLLFTKGWPTTIPTASEADLIASVRQRVSGMLAINAGYLAGDLVRARYAELIDLKHKKDQSRSMATGGIRQVRAAV